MENNKDWKHHNRRPEQNQDADCRPDEQLYIFIENALLPEVLESCYSLFTDDLSPGKFTCTNVAGIPPNLTEKEMFLICEELQVINFIVMQCKTPFPVRKHMPISARKYLPSMN